MFRPKSVETDAVCSLTPPTHVLESSPIMKWKASNFKELFYRAWFKVLTALPLRHNAVSLGDVIPDVSNEHSAFIFKCQGCVYCNLL